MKVVDRHQLHRGHAELAQVAHHFAVGQPGERAACARRHRRVTHRVAAHVQLVEHRVLQGTRGRPLPALAGAAGVTTHLGTQRALSRASNDRSASRWPTW